MLLTMKATSPSASRRWSRAELRAWTAVIASPVVTAIPTRRGREPGQSPLAPRLVALDQVVEPDPEHSRDQLENPIRRPSPASRNSNTNLNE